MREEDCILLNAHPGGCCRFKIPNLAATTMLRLLIFLPVLALISPLAASGQDLEAELRQAVHELYDDYNEGDAAAVLGRQASVAVGEFPRNGRLRQPRPQTLEEFQANLSDGLSFDRTVHHLDAYVLGEAGLTTFYTTGPTTYPDGSRLDGTYRASIVWVRESGQWKLVHAHISPLEAGP